MCVLTKKIEVTKIPDNDEIPKIPSKHLPGTEHKKYSYYA